jgi:SNF2 family DNA or RNA helicase
MQLFDADEGFDLLNCLALVKKVFAKHQFPLGYEEAQENGDDENESVQEVHPDKGSQSTPRKRRKRQVAESQSALGKRTRNQKTAQDWEDRTKLFLSQHQAQSSDLATDGGGIVVNTGKEADEEAIMINPHVAKFLKPHQVEGIRFMWREVVGTADDSDEPQGCLLAHVMGMGKSLQGQYLVGL